jgi:hypothetical protein
MTCHPRKKLLLVLLLAGLSPALMGCPAAMILGLISSIAGIVGGAVGNPEIKQALQTTSQVLGAVAPVAGVLAAKDEKEAAQYAAMLPGGQGTPAMPGVPAMPNFPAMPPLGNILPPVNAISNARREIADGWNDLPGIRRRLPQSAGSAEEADQDLERVTQAVKDVEDVPKDWLDVPRERRPEPQAPQVVPEEQFDAARQSAVVDVQRTRELIAYYALIRGCDRTRLHRDPADPRRDEPPLFITNPSPERVFEEARTAWADFMKALSGLVRSLSHEPDAVGIPAVADTIRALVQPLVAGPRDDPAQVALDWIELRDKGLPAMRLDLVSTFARMIATASGRPAPGTEDVRKAESLLFPDGGPNLATREQEVVQAGQVDYERRLASRLAGMAAKVIIDRAEMKVTSWIPGWVRSGAREAPAGQIEAEMESIYSEALAIAYDPQEVGEILLTSGTEYKRLPADSQQRVLPMVMDAILPLLEKEYGGQGARPPAGRPAPPPTPRRTPDPTSDLTEAARCKLALEWAVEDWPAEKKKKNGKSIAIRRRLLIDRVLRQAGFAPYRASDCRRRVAEVVSAP